MRSFLIVVCLAVAGVAVNAEDIDKCLDADSISCVQKSLYRKAREFFDQDSLELVKGVTLVKSADRSSRGGKQVMYDQEIDSATNVVERQSALENFVGECASEFLSGRSLRINFAPAIDRIGQSARAIANSVPEEVQQAVDAVAEGRGKKKLMKTLGPLLLAAKAKVGLLATAAFFAIGLLAKKAILASLLSIAISSFFAFKSMWSKGSDVTAYNAGGWSSSGSSSGGWSAPQVPSAGWSSSGSNGWDEPHSSNSFTAQSQAFSGYHR